MLTPRLTRPEVMAELSAGFRARGAVRVEAALRERHAAAMIGSLRAHPHAPFFQVDPDQGYQVWRYAWQPHGDCAHDLCALGRWLRGEGRAWAEAVTGLALAPDPEAPLVSDEVHKATFWDAYDDGGQGRAVAFMLHLVPASWPAEWGGHMEVLDAAGAVVSRWAPTWNALDLFDVRAPGAWRRLPMIREHLEGFIVSGAWLPAA
ncbi:MAG: hypothetical protein IT385_16755 [Deltaproteobacteria bacterium]|nr:hypothetical protein [Deltaproteobacteria bacterium]